MSRVLAIVAVLLFSGVVSSSFAEPPAISLRHVAYSSRFLRASDILHEIPVPEPARAETMILEIDDRGVIGSVLVRRLTAAAPVFRVPFTHNASSCFTARREQKRFRWGQAESCLSQFSNSNSCESPNNELLTYQLSGVTADGRFAVFASFSVRHPKLPTWEAARSYDGDSLEALQRDPDVRLIERTSAARFKPSLKFINEVVDSLSVEA